jgi:hypothetical protein
LGHWLGNVANVTAVVGFIVLAALMIALAVSTVHDVKNRDRQNVSALDALKMLSPTRTVIVILVLIVGVLLGGR